MQNGSQKYLEPADLVTPKPPAQMYPRAGEKDIEVDQ
jgi:hypothetical protein